MYRNLSQSIVAVDDSGIMLKRLESLLNDNYKFRGFTKGARALGFMKQEPPSLIILDINMPDIDGYELLHMIRSVDDLKEIPIIFLTSNSDTEHVLKAIRSGADDYVVKPVEEGVLMEKIRTLLLNNRKK